jgi:aminoglycoside phosphotransferase (APT) family kinase protein
VAAIKHFATKNPKLISLVHRDPHTGNTYLDKAGNPSFLDWQTFHIGSPFHDLAYFVISAISAEHRRIHEVAIIDDYLEALTIFGGPSFSTKDKDIMKEYSKATMAGMSHTL